MIEKQREKKKAVLLRQKGLSYSEILARIPVAKSTLSIWLRSVGLSRKQKQRLTIKKLEAMKRGWERVRQIRLDKTEYIKSVAAKEIGHVSARERWLLGSFLYWAEGSKENEHIGSTSPRFSNSDPLMVKFFQKWLKDFCKIKASNMSYELYIHKKADWEKAALYWSRLLGVETNKIRVYFKRHNPAPRRSNIGKNYHGQLRITVLGRGSSDLTRRISGWVGGICKHCGVV